MIDPDKRSFMVYNTRGAIVSWQSASGLRRVSCAIDYVMVAPFCLAVLTIFFTNIVVFFTLHFNLITQMQNNNELEGEAEFPQNKLKEQNTTRIVQRPFVDVLSISSLARPKVAMAQKIPGPPTATSVISSTSPKTMTPILIATKKLLRPREPNTSELVT